MLLRVVIKYYRRCTVEQLRVELPHMQREEEAVLIDLFKSRNYKPHKGTTVFRSFNSEFRDYIFSLPAFCHAFVLFIGMHEFITISRPLPRYFHDQSDSDIRQLGLRGY
jgi:hypothetical protein